MDYGEIPEPELWLQQRGFKVPRDRISVQYISPSPYLLILERKQWKKALEILQLVSGLAPSTIEFNDTTHHHRITHGNSLCKLGRLSQYRITPWILDLSFGGERWRHEEDRCLPILCHDKGQVDIFNWHFLISIGELAKRRKCKNYSNHLVINMQWP